MIFPRSSPNCYLCVQVWKCVRGYGQKKNLIVAERPQVTLLHLFAGHIS